MTYSNFNEHVFKRNVDDARKAVQRILEVHRNPRLAENIEHEYDNKYDLANLLTNTNVIAIWNCLERLGIDANVLKKSIDKSKPVTLRFQASESCAFFREQVVEVPSGPRVETTEETETKGTFFGSTKKTSISQIVNKVQEYHWKVDVKWEISIYTGTDVESRQEVQTRSSSMILVKQSQKRQPLPDHRDHNPIEVSLNWILQQIDIEKMSAQFKIDTQHEETKTPRRNKQVDDALTFVNEFGMWSRGILSYFTVDLQRKIIDQHNPAGPKPVAYKSAHQLRSVTAGNVFVPILPLMEDPETQKQITESESGTEETKSMLGFQETEENDEEAKSSPLLSVKDLHKLLNEQVRSLHEERNALQKAFPAKQLVEVVSVAEATLVMLMNHISILGERYTGGMNYIEKMLENQLVAAIGKRVRSGDLDKFVRYHNSKLLNPAPEPFCRSVRRPDHYPDGLLSIESNNQDGKMEPIDTLVREVSTAGPLSVSINAATTLQLTGKTFLHGWILHRFEDHRKNYKLIARARQFSSFMLVVGTMLGSDRLDPKDAIILQNKDEVIIPLLLNELPTATEFKDAIKSLSPEQQRFAKAFRSMQLESSVLGVCVIQIKPQLEELLNLPPDALTKEMKLTQDLMELFVEYQVPSDLLTYDGEEDEVSFRDKVNSVKDNVQSVLDVIAGAKTKQLEESAMRADMAFETMVADSPDYDWTGPSPPEMSTRRSGMKMKKSAASMERKLMQSMPTMAMAAPPSMMAMSAPPPSSGATTRSLTASSPARNSGVTKARVMQKSASRSSSKMASSFSVPNNASPQETSSKNTYDKNEISAADKLGMTKAGPSNGDVVDFTMMPKVLDMALEKYDEDNAVRSTIVTTDSRWTRNRQENLLSKPQLTTLRADDIKSEKDKAFDLLDALSRSGSLPISCSELHVIISVTHRFEKDVMETVIEDNVDPIEKLEMTTLLIGSAIHGVAASALVRNTSEKERLAVSFPALLEDGSQTED